MLPDETINFLVFDFDCHDEAINGDDDAIQELYCNRQTYLEAMNRSGQMNPILTIVGLLEKYRKTEKKKEA